jgi:selenocysteine lyase/cysteine desulfurase
MYPELNPLNEPQFALNETDIKSPAAEVKATRLLPGEPVRHFFPAATNYAYLNSAAVGPLSTVAIEAVNRQLRDVSEHGSEHYTQWLSVKSSARSLLASAMSVKPENLAFLRNTSDAFSVIANGIDWVKGDNIVSFEGEFPANYYPWRGVADRYGVRLKLAKSTDGCFDHEELVGLIDSRTRLVSVSAVQFSSGFRADLKFIADAAHSVEALFGVDLIQSLGARAYDLESLGVDFAAGGAHKWLCGPEGCGYLYVSDDCRKRIFPVLTGWISVAEPWDFEDRLQPFRDNALALESGTACSSLFYGLEASLKLLNQIGFKEIEAYLEELTDFFLSQLEDTDFQVVANTDKKYRSQIVALKHREISSSDAIASMLRKKGIIISARSGYLRVAPHLFNTKDDICRLVEALKEIQ